MGFREFRVQGFWVGLSLRNLSPTAWVHGHGGDPLLAKTLSILRSPHHLNERKLKETLL